jgi:uncharacterized DUF497 family protein
MINLEWDKRKDEANFKKHGFHFESAALVFSSAYITQEDTRKNYGERRFLSMGTLGRNGRVVIVAYTYRGSKLRIISMRKANRREQNIFYNYFS